MNNKTVVLSLLLSIFLLYQNAEALPWPIPPQDAAHAVNKIYGDWNVTVFHNAVDIPAAHGTPVLAVENGIVTSTGTIDTLDNCWVAIKQSTTDTTAWCYYHVVRKDSSIAKDSVVNAGDTIGHVCDFYGPGDPNDHIHFQLIDSFWIFNADVSYTNPLDSLSPPIPSQIPKIYSGRNLPHHPYQIYYVTDQIEDTTGSYESTYLRDSVDIIVRAGVNALGDTCSGVHALGYGIEPLNEGGNISFRKMFEMHGYMDLSQDSIKHCLTFAGPPDGPSSMSSHWKKYYVVTNCGDSLPQPNYGISNIKENCWPTKINTAGTANADSIEDAKFPDGYYATTIKVWSHSGDSAVALDTVLVDNFNPRVKETRPTDWFAFVPNKQKTIWFKFSEAMDTTTLTATNIKIQSLKVDSFNYPITNITYIDSTYELTLEVDSFRFKDTVQVRFSDSVTDLAGKSIESGSKDKGIAYTLTFVVSIKQLTDNDVDDITPDVHHGNIVWVHDSTGNGQGEIMLYDFYNQTTTQISPGGGIHNTPYIYGDEVAWIGYGWGSTNPVYYYDGSTTQQVAPANYGRYSMEISQGGIVWRSYWWAGGEYDTIWVEYYEPVADTIYTIDVFRDWYGRYFGRSDIDGDEIVWEHNDYPADEHEIYYYDGTVQNFSNDVSTDDWTPDISNGQIAWSKGWWGYPTYGSLWFYDGANKRELEFTYEPVQYPYLHNGSIIWFDEPGAFTRRLALYDGRNATELMQRPEGLSFYSYGSPSIHNNQVAWLRLVHETTQAPFIGYYNVSFYDGEEVIHLTVDTLGTGDSYRTEVHDGFVVFDAWDGNDYEIYLYIGDTLFTPPAIVRNLQGEILSASEKRVRLTWSPNSEPDLAGYNIYRSNIAYQFDTIPYTMVSAAETTFIDTLPIMGMNYYVATAFDNTSNEGGFSNQVEAHIDTTPPAPPLNLAATYDSVNQFVSLIWNTSTNGDLNLYRIYRSEISGTHTTPLDSVFAPDSTFIDSTILLGKTYYYVVSAVDIHQNESGFSNEDSVETILIADCAFSTAYNNGRKILANPVDNKIHFLYANEGWIVPDAGIYYCTSADTGMTFTRSEFVGETGVYPALGLDSQGKPCASWVSGSNFYYSYWGASWVPPEVWPVENVSSPSMTVDNADTVHLVFTHYLWFPPGNGNLIYSRFHRENFNQAVSETLLTDNYCHMPSLILDDSDYVHILWQGDNCICYQAQDIAGWFGIDTIYTTWTDEKLYPVIDHFGDKITAVWQDKDTLGNLEIYSRRKNGGIWEDIKKVAETSGESKFPTLTSTHYCLWQDNTPGIWDIYMSEYIDTSGSWTTPENITNSLAVSAYPHSAYGLIDTATAHLYCLWTEGDTIPYTIGYERIDVSPVARIYTDLGQETQSSHCLIRDGYWIFGEKPYESVDFGNDSISYKFTGLDAAKKYRLDVSYYFKPKPPKGPGISGYAKSIDVEMREINISNSPVSRKTVLSEDDQKGIGRLIQELVIDGISLDTSFIRPHRLVRISIWLPEELYADGEIITEIEKIKGKVVVCGEIALYEFSGEEEKGSIANMLGGPQSNETMYVSSLFFQGLYPNPAKGDLKVKFNSPNEREVTVKLYDVTGRLVDEIFNGKLKIGTNEIPIRSKKLAAGVYFIRIDVGKDIITEKVIMLK